MCHFIPKCSVLKSNRSMNILTFLFVHSKIVIYLIYSILMIYGLALIIWGMVDKITVADSPTSTVVIWMGVGIASMANAAMGLYGTKIDDKCLVYASIVFMFTSCVVQIVVTIIRVSMPLKETDAERKQLFRLFNEEDEEYLERFYQMQIDLECCGVTGFDDYEEKFDPLLLGYPSSCCKGMKSPCRTPFKTGCHQKVMEAHHREELIRAIIFVLFSGLKLLGKLVHVFL
ncbi:tetraspanin-9-like isoform X2 [Tenebrio molitor]|uniref:tetraspanin-9-like isoform X2 n=1 Tax=Tenebrio molitor TaxID=7067 RepID=UPI003624A1C7